MGVSLQDCDIEVFEECIERREGSVSALMKRARSLCQDHVLAQESEHLGRRWHKLVSGLQTRLAAEEEQRLGESFRSLGAWTNQVLEDLAKMHDMSSRTYLNNCLEKLLSLQVKNEYFDLQLTLA